MSSDWQLQTAKNRLSHVVDLAVKRGPQTITRHGKPTAVVLSVKDYQRIKSAGRPLSEFFARSPLHEQPLSVDRSRDTGRDVPL